MFDPLTGPIKPHRITTYDLEWRPADLEVRLAGAYDERGYRHYPSVDAFLDGELGPHNAGRRLYAHAGGLADSLFLLDRIVRRGDCQVEGVFSGSAAVLLTVRRGGYRFALIDSLFTLRAPLRRVGQWCGLAKGNADQDEAFYTDATDAELRDYNEQDCRILHHALAQFQDRVNALGAELKVTLASTAMDLFRRRYLHQSIETSETLNHNALPAYTASRVEVIRPRCRRAHYYDLNSSFPHAMRHYELPGSPTRLLSRVPRRGPFLVSGRVRVPSDCALPPLPYRIAGRVFFPTGEWNTTLTRPDLEALELAGGELVRVDEAVAFDPVPEFATFVDELYVGKQRATDPLEREVFKGILNSTYGKTCESRIADVLLVNPSSLPEAPPDRPELAPRRLLAGVYLVARERSVPHRHVPIGATVTAGARLNLLRCAQACGAHRIYYFDTDSITTTATLPTGPGLGELKLEYRVRSGRFVAPKLYALDAVRVGERRRTRVVHAKGLSGISCADFERLADDLDDDCDPDAPGPVFVPPKARLVRLREGWASGDTTPRQQLTPKRLQRAPFPKRAAQRDGSTRPWSIDELNTRFDYPNEP